MLRFFSEPELVTAAFSMPCVDHRTGRRVYFMQEKLLFLVGFFLCFLCFFNWRMSELNRVFTATRAKWSQAGPQDTWLVFKIKRANINIETKGGRRSLGNGITLLLR